MKRIWSLIFMVCLGLSGMLRAQNFEEAFRAFANQSQQRYNEFSDSINRQFAKAMAANMRAFSGERPKVRDPKPKPDSLPVVKGKETPDRPLPEPLRPSANPNPVHPQDNPQPKEPDGKPSENEPEEPSTEPVPMFELDLFGERFRWEDKPFPTSLAGVSVRDVSDFWIRLSGCGFDGILNTCRNAIQQKAFNDWAVYQFVLQYVQKKYDRQYNEQVVAVVFLLNQLGMEAKVGFSESHLFILLAVEQQLYAVPFSDINGHRYYIFELDPNHQDKGGEVSFQTYAIPFPGQTHDLDMNVRQPLKMAESSEHDVDSICISLCMIELFKTYPQVDMTVYANALPSEVFRNSLDRLLRPYIKNMSAYEAVSFLLYYLQYGFDYATDNEQFGYEKPFFCEENYYYPKNDCEDRAVLFSFLVRYLTTLNGVLIEYTGHVAAAVCFPDNVQGKSVFFNEKKYVICDPTYIGASIGMEMPKFKPEDRTVLPLIKWK